MQKCSRFFNLIALNTEASDKHFFSHKTKKKKYKQIRKQFFARCHQFGRNNSNKNANFKNCVMEKSAQKCDCLFSLLHFYLIRPANIFSYQFRTLILCVVSLPYAFSPKINLYHTRYISRTSIVQRMAELISAAKAPGPPAPKKRRSSGELLATPRPIRLARESQRRPLAPLVR